MKKDYMQELVRSLSGDVVRFRLYDHVVTFLGGWNLQDDGVKMEFEAKMFAELLKCQIPLLNGFVSLLTLGWGRLPRYGKK